MSEPYVKKDPGDIIRAQDWNEMQSQARNAVETHTHAGGAAGAQLTGAAIAPTADLQINSLAADKLSVKGRDVLSALDKLQSDFSTSLTRSSLTIDQVTLRKDGVSQDKWPVLTSGGANQATLNSGLWVSGSFGVGPAVPAARATLEVNGMVGNTVALFGETRGMSLVADWPNLGFNCYFNGGWKAISDGWPGDIYVNQGDGSMNFSVSATKANAADAALSFQNGLSIQADGKLVSPMWRVKTVWLNQNNRPPPAIFQSNGGTLIFFFSGSARALGDGKQVTLTLSIDQTAHNFTRYSHQGDRHPAFTAVFAMSLGGGSHTVQVNAGASAQIDGNDFFTLTILELPINLG